MLRYCVKDSLVDVILYGKDGKVKCIALIDKEDYNKVSGYNKWTINHRGYIKCNYKGKCIYLHRLIMDFPENMEVSHINENKLDNRKSNLRVNTRAENNQLRAKKGK